VLNQSFIDEFKVDGRSIDGADQVQSILSLGASAILGRNMLLDGAVGVGLGVNETFAYAGVSERR
jgi:hypothetical protein